MNDNQTTISEIKEMILRFTQAQGRGAGRNTMNSATSIGLEASELIGRK